MNMKWSCFVVLLSPLLSLPLSVRKEDDEEVKLEAPGQAGGPAGHLGRAGVSWPGTVRYIIITHFPDTPSHMFKASVLIRCCHVTLCRRLLPSVLVCVWLPPPAVQRGSPVGRCCSLESLLFLIWWTLFPLCPSFVCSHQLLFLSAAFCFSLIPFPSFFLRLLLSRCFYCDVTAMLKQ